MTLILIHGLTAAALFLCSVPVETTYRSRQGRTDVPGKAASSSVGGINKTYVPKGKGDAYRRPAIDPAATPFTTSFRTARRVMDFFYTSTASRKHLLPTLTTVRGKLTQPTKKTEGNVNQTTAAAQERLKQQTTPTQEKTTISTVKLSESTLEFSEQNISSSKLNHQTALAAKTSLTSRNNPLTETSLTSRDKPLTETPLTSRYNPLTETPLTSRNNPVTETFLTISSNSATKTGTKNETKQRYSSELKTAFDWRNVSMTTPNSPPNETATIHKEVSADRDEDHGRETEPNHFMTLFTNVTTQLSPHLESVAEENIDNSKDRKDDIFNQIFTLKNESYVLTNTLSQHSNNVYQTSSNGYTDNNYSDERMETSSVGGMDIDFRETLLNSNQSSETKAILSNDRTDHTMSGITETNIRSLTSDNEFSALETNRSTSSSLTFSPKLEETPSPINEQTMSPSRIIGSTTVIAALQQTETQTPNKYSGDTHPNLNVTVDSTGEIKFSDEVSSSTGTYLTTGQEPVKSNVTIETATIAVSTHSIPQHYTSTTNRPMDNTTTITGSRKANISTDLTSRDKGRQDTQSTVSVQRTTATLKTTSANFKELGTNQTTGEIRQHSTSSSPQNSVSSRTNAYTTDKLAIGTSKYSRAFYSNYLLTLPTPIPTGATMVGTNTGSKGPQFNNPETMSTSSLDTVDRFQSNNSFHSLEPKPTVTNIQLVLKKNSSATVDKVDSSRSTRMTRSEYNYTVTKKTLAMSASVDYVTLESIPKSTFDIPALETDFKLNPASSDASIKKSTLGGHNRQASRSFLESTEDMHDEGASTGKGLLTQTSTDNKKTTPKFVMTSVKSKNVTDFPSLIYRSTSFVPEDYWTADSVTESIERMTPDIHLTVAQVSPSKHITSQQKLLETSFDSNLTAESENPSILETLESSFKRTSSNILYKHTTTTSPKLIQSERTDNILSGEPSSKIELSLQTIPRLMTSTSSYVQTTSLKVPKFTDVATEVTNKSTTSTLATSADTTKSLTTHLVSNITESFITTSASITIRPTTSSNRSTKLPTTSSFTTPETSIVSSTANSTSSNATLSATNTGPSNATLSSEITTPSVTLSNIITKPTATTSASTIQQSTTSTTTTTKPPITFSTSSTQPATTAPTTNFASTSTKQPSSAQALTTSPTLYPSITSADTTEKQTILTTTTAEPPQLGSPCSPILDICNHSTNESVCLENTCSCIWYTYQQNNRCTKYSTNNFTHIFVANTTKESIMLHLPESTFRPKKGHTLDIGVTWSSRELSGSATTNQTSYGIQRLTPGTVYNITVQIVLRPPVGIDETFIVNFPSLIVMTDPPDPGQLVGSGRDLTDAFVLSPPTGTFDSCTAAILELDYVSESVGHSQWAQFNCTRLNIATLKPGIKFKVMVCVNVSDGSGQTKSSPWKSYFISKSGGVPGPVENLTVSNITSTSVKATWSPPQKTNGYITAYEVILKLDDGQCTTFLYVYSSETDKQTHSTQTCSIKKDFDLKQEETVMVTIKDLKVANGYILSVVAHNHINSSLPVTAKFTTAPEEPKPPSNVTATILTSTSVGIKWSPPARYPGPTDYTIRLWNSSMVLLFRVQGYATNSKEMKNLSPGTCYSLSITSNTSLGVSTPVELHNICLPENKSGQVTALNATSEPGSIKLSWAPPEQPNGQVKGYVIYLWSSSVCQAEMVLSPNKSMQVKYSKLDEVPKCSSTIRALNITLNARSFKYNIQNLASCQQYDVSVAAVNNAGVGMKSDITVTTTTPVPQTPSMLKCQSETPGVITFLWQRPVSTNCTTTYHLTLFKGHTFSNNSQSDYTITNVTRTSFTSVTFDKLDIYWPYTLLLNASTLAGVSVGTLSDVCRSLSDVPGPVVNVTNSPDPSIVTLTWSCPAEKDRHGEISEFHVDVSVISSNRSDLDDSSTGSSVILSTVPAGRYPCRHQYNISTTLWNQITYRVQIRAKVKDVDTLGQPVVKQVYFPAQAPKAILNTDKLLRSWTSANSANDSSTSVNICLRTLLDNRQGEIIAFGILVHVCFDEVCNAEKPEQFSTWPEFYISHLTWSQAKEKSFTQSYRATRESWQKLVWKNFTENILDVNFTVGDNSTCDWKNKLEYCNGPIPPRHPFRLELFSCTLGGCTSIGFPRLFYSAAAHTESSSDSIVIGGAVGGMTLAVVVLTIVVIIRLRLKLSKRLCKKRHSDMDHVIDLNDIEVCKDEGKSKPIRLRDFESTLSRLNADENALLNLEYQELNELSPIYSMDVGSYLDHHADNRWTNIIPFDHSRVKLKVFPEDPHAKHDYINGNYISGAESSRDYIATQGPLTRTIPDFWRMVWEQKVSAIVMLSDFEEFDKRTSMMREKVAKYYVDDAGSSPAQHGHIQVMKTCKVDCKDWEIRTFKLTHTTEKKSRLVKHFFFKYWSDHEADINAVDLIEFVRVVRSETSNDPPSPLVIHCSAGVGRTGTFIAVDYFNKLITRIKQRLDKGGQASEPDNLTVDIFGRVLSMREKRRFMVQTKAQYAFIYEAVKVLLNQVIGSGEQKTADKGTGQRESSSTTREDAVYDDVDSLKGQVAANCEPSSTV